MKIVLFTMELHRRYHGAGLSAAPFDPGFVNSNFGLALGSRFLAVMYHTPVRRLTATAEQAADQLVWLSTGMPGMDWKSGEYYAKHRIGKRVPTTLNLPASCGTAASPSSPDVIVRRHRDARGIRTATQHSGTA